jgi:hypothetical protein
MNAVRAVSTVTLLAGLWLFVSPWVYKAYMAPNAWNSWIVGAVIAILAISRLYNVSYTWMSWINCLLGIWTFASPWIYGYTGNEGRFVNSLFVGVIVFLLAVYNATTSHRTGQYPIQSHS